MQKTSLLGTARILWKCEEEIIMLALTVWSFVMALPNRKKHGNNNSQDVMLIIIIIIIIIKIIIIIIIILIFFFNNNGFIKKLIKLHKYFYQLKSIDLFQ